MSAPPLKIAMTGGSGLVGQGLAAAHARRGDACTILRRSPNMSPRWDLDAGVQPPDAFSGIDAVVHLAGENVASGRWTAARKARIRDSRIEGTARIVEAIARVQARPATLICASATGRYGDTGDTEVDEDGPPSDDFLGQTCVAWEREALKAAGLGLRVVLLRFGIVLSRDGGALAKMRPFFNAGLGGRVGSGAQGFPWVHIDDVVGAYLWALDGDVQGPVNVVAPSHGTNADFTRAYGKALGRPAVLPVPGFALRVAFGDMAQTLLTGAHVRPRVLQDGGYRFAYPTLDAALGALCARTDTTP